MPKNQPRPGQLLNGKQVKLLAQHAMVALLRFFDLVQIAVEIFLAEKRSSVDALQLRVLLVSQPVSPGDIQQLECFDLARRRDVRSAAEVEKVASLVNRNFLIGLGELLDVMALHEVAFALEFL